MGRRRGGMDPDECLEEILGLVVDVLDTETEDQTVLQLAQLVSDLDVWLTKGGALPKRWTIKREE